MAPHANKRNNRLTVTEKNEGSGMHVKKLLFLYIHLTILINYISMQLSLC